MKIITKFSRNIEIASGWVIQHLSQSGYEPSEFVILSVYWNYWAYFHICLPLFLWPCNELEFTFDDHDRILKATKHKTKPLRHTQKHQINTMPQWSTQWRKKKHLKNCNLRRLKHAHISDTKYRAIEQSYVHVQRTCTLDPLTYW